MTLKKISYVLVVFFLFLAFFLGESFFRKEAPLTPHENNIVDDKTGLNATAVLKIVQPTTFQEIIEAIKTTTGPISIGGARYSQGGQIVYQNSLHLDMRHYNKVISFNPHKKEITVEGGITWREIQEVIDPFHLSIKAMQTYANFTVGGSLSVNAHGRYKIGPLVSSVKAIKIVLADGRVLEASPFKNASLFYGAIGGYGGLGVIAEVTLSLEKNEKIARHDLLLKAKDYLHYFQQHIRHRRDIIFYNADIYPPHYEDVRSVAWTLSDRPLTEREHLIPEGASYFFKPKIVSFVGCSRFGRWVRQYIIDPLYYGVFSRNPVVWRNFEASYDTAELGPIRRGDDVYALREYFVPVDGFYQFLQKMRVVFEKYQVDVINVSLRFAEKDPGSLLAWSRGDTFSFVIFYKEGTTLEEMSVVKRWTNELIDAALELGGSYYLPYQISATKEQFLKAYPKARDYFFLKKQVDPKGRFMNKLFEAYSL